MIINKFVFETNLIAVGDLNLEIILFNSWIDECGEKIGK